MIKPSIEEYICRELLLDEQEVALDFISFLKDNNLIFYKDNCDCWKNKIYYWVKLDDECVCFIAIKDPDEKDNHWTVWSDDMGSEWLEQCLVDDKVKELAWKHIDHCGHCNSCGGGRHKVIFGKEFDDVCGCTFRIDNPTLNDLFSAYQKAFSYGRRRGHSKLTLARWMRRFQVTTSVKRTVGDARPYK